MSRPAEKALEQLLKAFEAERDLCDRLFEGLDHAAVFPGWGQLRESYKRTRLEGCDAVKRAKQELAG